MTYVYCCNYSIVNPAWLCLYSTVYSDGWRVTNVWNSKQLVSKKSRILSQLGQHVLSDKPHRETDIVSSTCNTIHCIYTFAISNKLDTTRGLCFCTSSPLGNTTMSVEGTQLPVHV